VAKATFFGVLFIRQLKLTAMDNYTLQLASANCRSEYETGRGFSPVSPSL